MQLHCKNFFLLHQKYIPFLVSRFGVFDYMAKKIRRMRTFARTASKSMEKKLIENAKTIKNDPFIVIPDYDDNYSKRIFKKIEKSIEKINRFKEDTDKLEKLSNKRGLDGAIAGTILIAHSKKAPYLAVAKYPTGDVTYAQRGRAEKEKLIAVQHFDDPILRVLGIKDIALKKRMYIYSWDDEYISTGLDSNPPDEFLDFLIDKKILKKQKNVYFCGDVKAELIEKKEFNKKNYLRIYWKSADIYIGICEDCAKNTKNTMYNMTKYMIHPNISNDFEIDVIGKVIKDKSENLQTIKIDEYLSGELTDYDFITKNMSQREEDLKDSGEKVFILDGKSYGTDINDFIKALKPNEYEQKGLEVILDNVDEPVVMDNVTPNKVLERFWDDYGADAINELIDDEDMSKKFYQLDEEPSDILKLVLNFKKRQKILSLLPTYQSLPPIAKFADKIARTYKTFGKKEAIVELKKRPDNPKGKSIAYAFLLVFGKASDKKWQYSQIEIEYGEFLKENAKKLLESKPENYHKHLQELLTASGSSEDISSNKK